MASLTICRILKGEMQFFDVVCCIKIQIIEPLPARLECKAVRRTRLSAETERVYC